MKIPDTHAQFDEDRLLAAIFAGQAAGVCLEVGAFDGVTGSATYAFERQGWTAILVEPLPAMAPLIRRERRGPFYPVAAGPVSGRVTFFCAEKDPAISSLAANEPQGQLYALRNETLHPVEVDQLTLDEILVRSGVDRVDFATIDVEGHELGVLQGWDLSRWRPRVIIVEDNSRGLDTTVPRHLAAAGYACFRRTGVNDWYAHRDDRRLTGCLAVGSRRLWRHWRSARVYLKTLLPDRARGWARRHLALGE